MALNAEMLDKGGYVSSEALSGLVGTIGRGPTVFRALGDLVGGQIHDLYTADKGSITAPVGYGRAVAHRADRLLEDMDIVPPPSPVEADAFLDGIVTGAQLDRYPEVNLDDTARGAFDSLIALTGRGQA